ncbi:MAG: GNAT family N-acetyltransferase [Solirubrobacterales bacterium]|nr:GNAT family N-acetyltransferase [Solirubrobacterales bacterium]
MPSRPRTAAVAEMTDPPIEQITTRDGVSLLVRPIEAADKEALRHGFEHLSPESRYRRFLAPIKELTRHDLRYFTEVDHRDHEALVAVAPSAEPVAVARYVRLRERPEAADVAVTVADEWQGRGVGTALLERLARRAITAGIIRFVGVCLAANEDMIELLRDLGPAVTRRHAGGSVIEVEVELPRGDHPALASRAPRAVARAGTAAEDV